MYKEKTIIKSLYKFSMNKYKKITFCIYEDIAHSMKNLLK